MTLSCLMPMSGNQRCILGDVVLADELEASVADELFVAAWRHKQEQPDRATHRQLIVGYGPADDNRIGEKCTTSRPENALPLSQHTQPAWEVVHRVDAEEPVERVVGKRQGGTCVNQSEIYAISSL